MDSGDTAWMLTSTAFVMFMTLPGLAMVYAGLVQSKSVLSVVMQCFSITAISSLLWFAVGYSLSFGESLGWFIGIPYKAFFLGITSESMRGTIPEIVFVIFQMTFAMIAPVIIVGAYAERMKFSAVLLFSLAWSLLVYMPICHWVWGGGWLAQLGIMDFAGGLVLHANVGATALVAAVMVGRRLSFPNRLMPPHNPGMTAVGTGMVWVGWFGFNGGSAFAANGEAGMAIAVTHISATAAAVTWIALDLIRSRHTSLIGAVTGVIAGLAAVTPASGFVGPIGGLVLGVAAAAVCFFSVGIIKGKLNIDDTLDVFAVHGLGGIIGTLMVAVLAVGFLGGGGVKVADGSILTQLGVQALGIVVSMLWAALFTFLILKLLGLVLKGVRVDYEDEVVGLDLAVHGERGYDL